MTTSTRPPTTALAVINPSDAPLAAQVFGEDRLTLLAEQIGRGWKVPPTPDELDVIALICQRNRFDIFAKPAQVHFIKRWDAKLGKEVMTPQTSIDGMRLSASRSRDYIGPAGWSWCGDDGIWRDVWLSPDPPRAARAGVLRRGVREPMYAVALWDEWVQEVDEYRNGQKTGNKVLAPFWKAKPAHMLAKTAEMIVLKQSFPAETNELELAHLEELHRLEAPGLAAAYEQTYGADEDHAFAELPPGAGAPTYTAPRERTDLEDLPREQPTTVSPPPLERRIEASRGDLLDMYSTLLTQARQNGVVSEADMARWVIGHGSSDAEIVDKGRALRSLVNQATIARASQQSQQMAAPSEDTVQPPQKPKQIGVRSAPAQRLAGLIEDAARMEVDFDDCRVQFPADEEEVIRKSEKLDERIAAEEARRGAQAQDVESGAAQAAF